MPEIERLRQPVPGVLNPQEMQNLREQGWILVALEWERRPGSEESAEPAAEEAPFGLQVTGDGLREEPEESAALVAMLELLVEEGPYWRIAEELNRGGHRTRRGGKWSPVSVFEMLPRLIEAAPHIFASAEWQRRRHPPARRG